MKRINTALCILISSFISYTSYANGVATSPKTLKPLVPHTKTALLQNADLPNIHNISITGPCYFHLTTSAEKERIVLSGIDHPYRALKVKIKNHVLYLYTEEPHLIIDAFLNDLHHLSLNTLHSVVIEAPQPSRLSLDVKDTPALYISGKMTIPTLTARGKCHINTEGKINLRRLNAFHSGTITLSGIVSDTITINQNGPGQVDIPQLENHSVFINAIGTGLIRLSGLTHQLIAHIAHHSALNAKTLKSYHVFIKTFDSALAIVHPLERLFASAQDSSKIDYVNNPHQLYKHALGYGVILYTPIAH